MCKVWSTPGCKGEGGDEASTRFQRPSYSPESCLKSHRGFSASSKSHLRTAGGMTGPGVVVSGEREDGGSWAGAASGGVTGGGERKRNNPHGKR